MFITTLHRKALYIFCLTYSSYFYGASNSQQTRSRRMTHENDLHLWPTIMTHENDPRYWLTRMTHVNNPQVWPTRLTLEIAIVTANVYSVYNSSQLFDDEKLSLPTFSIFSLASSWIMGQHFGMYASLAIQKPSPQIFICSLIFYGPFFLLNAFTST